MKNQPPPERSDSELDQLTSEGNSRLGGGGEGGGGEEGELTDQVAEILSLTSLPGNGQTA